MSPPSTDELQGVIVDMLSSARDDGRLSQLTVRIVRRRLATHFNLEEEVLNGETYKSFIKATNSLQSASEEHAEDPPRKVVKKEKAKSGGAAKTGARKPRVKKAPEAARSSESEALPPKKASVHSKPSKPDKLGKAPKKPESEAKFKSKAIIESSDDEAAPGSTRSPKKRTSAKSSPKQTQASSSKKTNDHSDVGMDSADGPVPPESSPKLSGTTEIPKASVSRTQELARDPMESELSSVADEPPKKRQKKQEKELTKSRKDEKTKRGKKEALSKDEETVNRLKGIVVACGIRRVWKKEFEGLDKPSQQIKRLHAILGDLGMTPRYSLEKAKAIRQQRELARELMDVQEFEKATKGREEAVRNPSGTEESADQGDSGADVPATKKQNARASIMAFLQDQSEED